ncbi:MAG: hypothetical protein ABIF04_02135 [Chloroflexota bacterium]
MVLDGEVSITKRNILPAFPQQEYATQGNSTGTPTVYDYPSWEGQTGWGGQYLGVEPNIQFILFQFMNELKALGEQVKSLREELSNRPLVSSPLLNDLGNKKTYVKVPISILFEETDEECLARWPEINAFGIGSTASEAISNLKRHISDLFFDLSSRDKATLGAIALDNLRTLETHIGVKE